MKMSLRSFVSFEADFPTDGQPPGKELADFIASAIRDKSVGCTGPEEREGWAWQIFWQAGSIQLGSIIGFADDAPAAVAHHHLRSRPLPAQNLRRRYREGAREEPARVLRGDRWRA
jgi:hypothetical protein